jgi:SagB-type dehydrogenase family enzyme
MRTRWAAMDMLTAVVLVVAAPASGAEMGQLARVSSMAAPAWAPYCFTSTTSFASDGAGGVSAADTLIRLPAPRLDGGSSVEEALSTRRSARHWDGADLSLPEVAQLLWAAQGVTESIGDAPSIWRGSMWMGGLRTAPSAGALYPLEFYLVASAVNGLEPGVYRYIPLDHSLEWVMRGDRRQELAGASFMQSGILEAPAVFVIAAVHERTAVKYGVRAERYVHMEAGAAAENLWLQAESLHLGTVFIGAFRDEAVKQVIGAPADHQPLVIMAVGRKSDDWRERRGF